MTSKIFFAVLKHSISLTSQKSHQVRTTLSNSQASKPRIESSSVTCLWRHKPWSQIFQSVLVALFFGRLACGLLAPRPGGECRKGPQHKKRGVLTSDHQGISGTRNWILHLWPKPSIPGAMCRRGLALTHHSSPVKCSLSHFWMNTRIKNADSL